MAGHHNLQGTEQVKGSCAALKQSLGIAGMNIGWKNSNQAMNYRRRGFSLALGSFRNMVHTISDCWGRTAITVFMTQTHTKKNPPGVLVLDKTQGLSQKWLSQLAGGARGADSSWPFFRSHCLELGYVGISSL